ncbi:MAG: H-NS histone family protein [Cellulophaga sp.]
MTINIKELTLDKLKVLSLQDLLSFQKILDEAITVRTITEKAELLEKMNALASESGFTLDELIGKNSKQSKNSVKIKYRHPSNASLTWTGRGRTPKWVNELIASGKNKEDFEVT